MGASLLPRVKKGKSPSTLAFPTPRRNVIFYDKEAFYFLAADEFPLKVSCGTKKRQSFDLLEK